MLHLASDKSRYRELQLKAFSLRHFMEDGGGKDYMSQRGQRHCKNIAHGINKPGLIQAHRNGSGHQRAFAGLA